MLAAACSTTAVDRDEPDYNHASYVFDLGICNTNDLVVNALEGTGKVLVTTGAGFLYGAGIASNGTRHTYYHGDSASVYAATVLVGGSIGAAVGVGYGVFVAFDEITLATDRCMKEQGYMLLSDPSQ